MNEEQNKQIHHLKWFGLPRLMPYLKPYGLVFLCMIVLGLLTGLVDIVMPLFQQYAIDHFIGMSTLDGLAWFILAYAFVLVAQVVMSAISCYQASYVETCVARDMRRIGFNHLQTLSFSYFNQNSVGYIHARIMSDTSRIGGTISWDLMDGLWNMSYLVGAIVVMLRINWKLALCVIVIVPIVALASAYFQGKLVKLDRRIRETNSQITGKFNEGITGVKTTKTLVTEKKMDRAFCETTGRMKQISVHAAHFRALFQTVITFAGYLALSVVLWRGGLITIDGVMRIGTLSVFLSYAQGMMGPVQWVVRAMSDMITVQVNIERFTTLMETESNVVDSPEVIAKYGDTFEPKTENWEPMTGDVEFRDLSFKYPDGEEMVIEHFNLTVPAGSTVAIVGETGAGKSTLVNLLCRFYEPTAGQVLIDGRDVRERSQLWLHSNLGYVLQTPHLFSGTVLENLRYGNPNATMEQIEAACRLVSADKVIERMDGGYDAQVGEGGDMLSTGEKQLLSFARAVLADPRLFVLDEATSSIDTVTEQLIQDATQKLMEGRTTFVVAHRLSTIRSADTILVVSGGKIVERGNHDQLMAQRGHYYGLYTRQYADENTRAAWEERKK